MSRLLSFFLLFLLSAALFTHFPSVRSEEVDGEGETGEVDMEDSGASESSTEGGSETGTEPVVDEPTDVEFEEPNSRYNSDLVSRVFFPSSPEKKFTQGEEVTLLVGVSNNGLKTYNLTAVAASLKSPYDHSYAVQNYSAFWINGVLEAGKEITIEYKFKPHENLEPLEFPLEAFLFYNTTDTGDMYRATVFNSTITILEKDIIFNPQTFFTYILFIGAVGFGVYSLLPASATKKRSKKTSIDQPAAEWTVEDYKPAQKSKVARRSRK